MKLQKHNEQLKERLAQHQSVKYQELQVKMDEARKEQEREREKEKLRR